MNTYSISYSMSPAGARLQREAPVLRAPEPRRPENLSYFTEYAGGDDGLDTVRSSPSSLPVSGYSDGGSASLRRTNATRRTGRSVSVESRVSSPSESSASTGRVVNRKYRKRDSYSWLDYPAGEDDDLDWLSY